MDLEQVLLKAMAVPMDNRFQSMAELRLALQQITGLGGASPTPVLRPAATAALGQSAGPAAAPAAQKPAPVPVPPIVRKTTTAPPPPQGFLERSWPLLLLGGAVFVVLLLVIGSLNRSAPPDAAGQLALYTATASRSAGSISLEAGGATLPAAIFTPLARETPLAPSSTASMATPTLPTMPAVMLEGFTRKPEGWREGLLNGLDCRLDRGKYICELQPGATISEAQWLEHVTMEDIFILAVDIRLEKTSQSHSAGLVFHSSDDGRYLFSIRSDGFFRVASVQDEPANFINLIEWQRSAAVRLGENNRLVVHGSGDVYAFYINGAFVGQLQDRLWTGGYPGVHIFSAPQPKAVTVEFDQFELRQP
jgi:hypothetical protein